MSIVSFGYGLRPLGGTSFVESYMVELNLDNDIILVDDALEITLEADIIVELDDDGIDVELEC